MIVNMRVVLWGITVSSWLLPLTVVPNHMRTPGRWQAAETTSTAVCVICVYLIAHLAADLAVGSTSVAQMTMILITEFCKAGACGIWSCEFLVRCNNALPASDCSHVWRVHARTASAVVSAQAVHRWCSFLLQLF